MEVDNLDRKLVSVEEAARTLSIGRSLLFEMLSAGTIRSVKVGRRRLVPVSALEEYVKRLTEDQSEEGTA